MASHKESPQQRLACIMHSDRAAALHCCPGGKLQRPQEAAAPCLSGSPQVYDDQEVKLNDVVEVVGVLR